MDGEVARNDGRRGLEHVFVYGGSFHGLVVGNFVWGFHHIVPDELCILKNHGEGSWLQSLRELVDERRKQLRLPSLEELVALDVSQS